jgi:iron complex transport system ATP-binding protein
MREVTAAYAGNTHGGEPELDAVDLAVAAGEIVCVLGPNGAGKTTLVRVASGLLPPVRGEVLLLGEPLHRDRSRTAVAKVLAVVEQTPTFSGTFTVRSVVEMGRAPHQGGWMKPTAADAKIVDAALERCDLRDLGGRPANALSGGEQKRVAIARALAQEPKILLLDEPGAFLDVRHQLDLYELLVGQVKEQDLACLVVMHDLSLAAQFADRVVLMKAGRIVASGPVAEVMTADTLRATFDTDLDCGTSAETGARFFLPRRKEQKPG